MATARIGGTSGKLSGQVGEKVFQIRKNQNGTYTQIVYEKGVRVESVTSPRLQAQRMVTAMVESLMKRLKPVGQISMQSGTNKTKSLNAFSSANLLLVAQDCKANWYTSHDFIYPLRMKDTNNAHDMGGLFILSSGTGTINHFNRCFESISPQMIITNWPSRDEYFNGLEFVIPTGCVTIGDYLRKARITRLDKVVFCYHWWTYVYGPEEGVADEKDKHDYIIMSVNQTLPDSTPLTESSLQALWNIQASEDRWIFRRGVNPNTYYCGVRKDLMKDETITYRGAFTISYATGKKLITDSRYSPQIPSQPEWIAGYQPSQVFWSWMDEPRGTIIPSPFE